ncbi:MAG: Glucose-6-phosphate 1-dehydrogenase 2 [Chlamydiia bacterium]|nr:Glucose-6-phosphate 1-dehydrogenase 2 [Chlamydiia bacterium]
MSQEKFENPFTDKNAVATPQPVAFVLFGATGDLTQKKIMPALYCMKIDGQLPANFVCVAFARRDKTDDEFREEMRAHIQEHSRIQPIDEEALNAFLQQIVYHKSDFDDPAGYASLKTHLAEIDQKYGTSGNRIFYCSVPAEYFPVIAKQLHDADLVYPVAEEEEHYSRLVIEKPFGTDTDSAYALQKDLTEAFDESQIYRIDHYLGKETVQNMLVLRFANAFYEAIWNSRYIENIQITVAEGIGIEGRGSFYEQTGIARDILQNHAMQLLALTAMEPPSTLLADHIRDEKVKVLQSIRPYSDDEIKTCACRGQYGKGFVDGEEAKPYREEDNVDPKSSVETFAGVKVYVDNLRWAGVPFYVRTGKRCPKRTTEITVTLKKMPRLLFLKDCPVDNSDVITFRIQPNEGVEVVMNSKVPGQGYTVQPVKLNFCYEEFFGTGTPEAYERLISDCMIGDKTLFARVDEAIASWKFFTPILKYWKETPLDEKDIYAAGTWGPESSNQIMEPGDEWKKI